MATKRTDYEHLVCNFIPSSTFHRRLTFIFLLTPEVSTKINFKVRSRDEGD